VAAAPTIRQPAAASRSPTASRNRRDRRRQPACPAGLGMSRSRSQSAPCRQIGPVGNPRHHDRHPLGRRRQRPAACITRSPRPGPPTGPGPTRGRRSAMRRPLSSAAPEPKAGEPAMSASRRPSAAAGYGPARSACADDRIGRLADVSCCPRAARSRRCRRGRACPPDGGRARSRATSDKRREAFS
jgi:hypothetical protein